MELRPIKWHFSWFYLTMTVAKQNSCRFSFFFIFFCCRRHRGALSTEIETSIEKRQRHWVEISRLCEHAIGQLQPGSLLSTFDSVASTFSIPFRARTHSSTHISAREDENDKKILGDDHRDFLRNFSSCFWCDYFYWNCSGRQNRTYILSSVRGELISGRRVFIWDKKG